MLYMNQEKVSTQYLFDATRRLRALKNDDAKNTQNLFECIEDIIKKFPAGENKFIHFESSAEYKEFRQELMDAVCKKIIVSNYQYSRMVNAGKYSGKCVEALLFQQLAKLPISMAQCANQYIAQAQGKNNITFKELLCNLIERSTRFFKSKSKFIISDATHILSALTRIDIQNYEETRTDRFGFQSVVNPKIKDLFEAISVKILKNPENFSLEGLIRYIHSAILLSRKDDDFKTYLKDEDVKPLLRIIANKLNSLNSQNTGDRQLAQQLMQIRNVYPDIFPDTLSEMIQPFLTVFNADTHGSRFEQKINQKLVLAANELATEYPHLIDAKHFNANNPINESLGLEADITYENGLINVCIEVDGDRYHKYTGSTRRTQRTELRDYCFLRDNWQLINFTDDNSSADFVKDELVKKVVMPTYEAIIEKNKYLIQEFKASENEFSAHAVQLNECLTTIVNPMQDKLATLKQTASALSNLGQEYQQIMNVVKELENEMKYSADAVTNYQLIVNNIQNLSAEMESVMSYQNISFILEENINQVAQLERQNQDLTRLRKPIQDNVDKFKLINEQLNNSLNSSPTDFQQKKLKQSINENNQKLQNNEVKLAKVDADKSALDSQIKTLQDEIAIHQAMFKDKPIGFDLAKKIEELKNIKNNTERFFVDIETKKQSLLNLEEKINQAVELDRKRKIQEDKKVIEEGKKVNVHTPSFDRTRPLKTNRPCPPQGFYPGQSQGYYPGYYPGQSQGYYPGYYPGQPQGYYPGQPQANYPVPGQHFESGSLSSNGLFIPYK